MYMYLFIKNFCGQYWSRLHVHAFVQFVDSISLGYMYMYMQARTDPLHKKQIHKKVAF